jgi:recombinational DNA repair protein RecR
MEKEFKSVKVPQLSEARKKPKSKSLSEILIGNGQSIRLSRGEAGNENDYHKIMTVSSDRSKDERRHCILCINPRKKTKYKCQLCSQKTGKQIFLCISSSSSSTSQSCWDKFHNQRMHQYQ